MTKKTTSRPPEGPLPAAFKESAQQIWSAGVDAITRAQEQSNRVFDALVREGEALRENIQKKTLVAASVGDVATDTWDKLEQVFEKRVARALSTLGVPTRSELLELNERIDALTKLVRQQSGSTGTTATKAKAATTTRKTPATRKPKA